MNHVIVWEKSMWGTLSSAERLSLSITGASKQKRRSPSHKFKSSQLNHPIQTSMPPKKKIPDAWDDDWETLADVCQPIRYCPRCSHALYSQAR